MPGRAHGKVILLGEHFVLYNLPALVGSIALNMEIKLTPAAADEVATNQPTEPGDQTKATEVLAFLRRQLGITTPLTINVESQLPARANLGSSAAYCVALVRALADFYQHPLTDNQTIDLATRAEHLIHGHSSGLDPTAAALDGILTFQRQPDGVLAWEQLQSPLLLHLVIGQSPEPAQTNPMINRVSHFATTQPFAWKENRAAYQRLADQAGTALRRSDLNQFGQLFDANHGLLQNLNVSTRMLDRYCDAARQDGALGAKLTGGGGGGSMVALAQNPDQQQRLRQTLQTLGADVFLTTIG